MPNPFADDYDDTGPSNDQVTNSIEERARELGTEPAADIVDIEKEEMEEVLFQDDDDEATREEKKLNRYREQIEGRARAEEQARIYKEELERFRMATPNVPPASQPAPEDPVQKALDENYDNRVRLFEGYQAKVQSGNLTPDEQAKYLKDSRNLEEKQQELIAEKVLQRSGTGAHDPNAAMRQTIQARYFDVVSNPQVRQWTIGRYHQRIAEGANSDPNSIIPLLDDIAEEARQRFRIGKYRNGPAPTEATKARHMGPPVPGSGGSRDERPKGIKMTPELKKLADAYGSHITDDRERWKHWVNGPGKRFVENRKKT